MNLDISDKLQTVCIKLLNSIPTEIVDEAGNKIEGIEFIPADKVSAEKK